MSRSLSWIPAPASRTTSFPACFRRSSPPSMKGWVSASPCRGPSCRPMVETSGRRTTQGAVPRSALRWRRRADLLPIIASTFFRPTPAERLHQVDAEGEAGLPVAHEGDLGIVGGALRVEHFQVGRVAGFITDAREVQRIACRLYACQQVGF